MIQFTEICSTVTTVTSEHFVTSERNQNSIDSQSPSPFPSPQPSPGCCSAWAGLFCVFQVTGVVQLWTFPAGFSHLGSCFEAHPCASQGLVFAEELPILSQDG